MPMTPEERELVALALQHRRGLQVEARRTPMGTPNARPVDSFMERAAHFQKANREAFPTQTEFARRAAQVMRPAREDGIPALDWDALMSMGPPDEPFEFASDLEPTSGEDPPLRMTTPTERVRWRVGREDPPDQSFVRRNTVLQDGEVVRQRQGTARWEATAERPPAPPERPRIPTPRTPIQDIRSQARQSLQPQVTSQPRHTGPTVSVYDHIVSDD